MNSRILPMAAWLFSSLFSCQASATPPNMTLACPEGTSQKTLHNTCNDTVTCVPDDANKRVYAPIPVVEFYPSGTKRSEYSLVYGVAPVGPWKSWYPNGAQRFEGRYKADALDGRATEWYSNGRKHAEVVFADGRPDGVARLWSPSNPAVVRIEANWKNREHDGTWKSYFPDGKPEIDLHMKKGRVDGPVTIWAANGQKIEEFTQFDEDKEGQHRKWNPQGQLLLEENYKGGRLHGQFREFFPNGHKKTEATYKDGALDGIYNDWFESGSPQSSGSYAAAEKQGPWRTWYPNGQVESEIPFRNGHESPGWKRFYPDGKASSQLSVDGSYEQFHPNGKLQASGSVDPQGRSGTWVWYDEQGRRERTGAFASNWAEGQFVWFGEDGHVITKETYRKGVLTSIRCPKGTRLSRQTPKDDSSLRCLSCRDGNNRFHGTVYCFFASLGGEYATDAYVHGVPQDLCAPGVDKVECRPGVAHAPFAVLRKRHIPHGPETNTSDVSDTETTTANTTNPCSDENADRSLQVLDAFLAPIDVWSPSALKTPEFVQSGPQTK